jgi:hypothetical protein
MAFTAGAWYRELLLLVPVVVCSRWQAPGLKFNNFCLFIHFCCFFSLSTAFFRTSEQQLPPVFPFLLLFSVLSKALEQQFPPLHPFLLLSLPLSKAFGQQFLPLPCFIVAFPIGQLYSAHDDRRR